MPRDRCAAENLGLALRTYPGAAAAALCGRKIAAPPKVLGSALRARGFQFLEHLDGQSRILFAPDAVEEVE